MWHMRSENVLVESRMACPMSGQALSVSVASTCPAHALPVTCVVVDDVVAGLVDAWQRDVFFHPFPGVEMVSR